MMKTYFIALIAGIIFVLSVILLVMIIQYVLTIYVKTNEHISFRIKLNHGGLSITIGVLIAIEIYLILM